MYKSALKSVILTAIAFAGLSISSVSMAAGTTTLHIEQKGGNGQWALTYPTGSEFTDTAKTKILSNLEAGMYRLNVRPPSNAYATIELYENNVLKQTSNVSGLTFDMKENTTYRATVTYTFGGTIHVNSTPAGVRFEMTAQNGNSYTGTTPATFTDMPTSTYRVTYGLEANCEAKKTQERPLGAGGTLTFVTTIQCGDQRIATPGKTAKQLANGSESTTTVITTPAQRIVQTSSVSEVVAGGRVRVTLSVRNVTKQSLRNVQISDTFNPDMITIVAPLADNGTVSGNMLNWTVPSIYAGQTWSTTFEFTVNDSVQTGERILLLANATSDGDDSINNPEAWSSVVSVSVAYLPQTGNMLDMIFVLAAMLAATIITILTMRRKAPVALTA